MICFLTIYQIWKSVLCLEAVDIHKNFFDCGGDSLLLFQLHTKLECALNCQFSPSLIFSYPTVYSLYQYFSQLLADKFGKNHELSAQARAEKSYRGA